MPKLADITSDPEFYKLSHDEQKQVVGRVDPSFTSLGEVDQRKIIGKIKLNYLKSDAYKNHNGMGETKKPDQLSDFGSTLWSDAKSILPGIGNTIAHPFETGKQIGAAQADQGKKAYQSYKEGDYSSAGGHIGAALLPTGEGPLAVQTGEELGRGEYGKAAAHGLEMLVPRVVSALPKKGKVGPVVKETLNPVEKKALQSVKGEIRSTAGQRTGNVMLQRTEQALENLAGSSSRAHRYYGAQQEEIADAAARRAERASPVKTDAVGAGQDVKDRLANRILKLQNHSDRMYDDVRSATSANKQTVQTGTKQSTILGPSGKPLSTPVTSVLETPVALDPIRAPLKTIYDNLQQNMPEVRRLNSPAFTALKNLMESGETHMNAMDFDKFLGAVKALSREGKSEYLTNVSQRLAKQIIQNGENQLNKALLTAGSDVPNKLRIGRGAVRSYYETGEVLADLHDEPASVYKKLVAGGDTSNNLLNTLQKYAPHQLKTVGRTFLEGMITKATQEGGFGRAAGIVQDWKNLGPRAKRLMFGPKLTNDVSNLLIAAKKLTRPLNPTGSGHQMGAIGAASIVIGAGMNAGWSLITGQFMKAAVEAGTAVSAIAVPNIMARVLFSPGGANLLTKAITLPVRTPARIAAMTALGGKILAATKEEKSKDSAENSQQQ